MASGGGYAMSVESTLLYQDLEPDAKEVMTYFRQQHRFRFIKSLHSTEGGALLCDELEPNNYTNGSPTILRKLVIKHGLMDLLDPDIENEINALRRLRGAEHIIQLIRYVDPYVHARPVLSALRRPYFVMEYVPGGPIDSWIGLHHDENTLWSIFLCLARACTAMAYPPRGPSDGPLWREIPPEGPYGPAPLGLIHGDMHGQNVMVDDYVSCDPEHALAPRIKMIDFGFARIEQNAQDGIRKNLYDVGDIMMSLATGRDTTSTGLGPAERPVTSVSIRNGASTRQVDTHAVSEFGPSYSTDFLELVQLCLAVDPDEQPSLASVLTVCSDKVYSVTTRYWNTRLRFDADH